MSRTTEEIHHELEEHIPFTAAATAVAVAIMAILLAKTHLITYAVSAFWVFHPAHIFFSSIVSAAIFYKYRNKFWLALISAVVIAVVIGSLSDVIFPYLGSLLFRIPITFELPALESPLLIFGIAFLGSLVGIATRFTKFPHFLHVLISLFASLLYIFAYSSSFSLVTYIAIFIITTISVVIPCCSSDIIFPIIFQSKTQRQK
jgi:hypothetical protein